MNDELIAKTPIGEIVVGIKSDHDYPGIFVELRGEHLNDRFKEGAVRLAWVEYSSDKQCLQTIAYGDGNADDFTHLKVGYIYISIDSCRGTVGDMDCLVIDSPEELLDKLLYEMAVDIMEEVGHTIDPTEATLLERREIERRIHPYLEQLPTYQDRLQRVFTREKD